MFEWLPTGVVDAGMGAAAFWAMAHIYKTWRDGRTKDDEIESSTDLERDRLQLERERQVIEAGNQLLQSVRDRMTYLETEGADLRQRMQLYDSRRHLTERLMDDATTLFGRVVDALEDQPTDRQRGKLVLDINKWLARSVSDIVVIEH